MFQYNNIRVVGKCTLSVKYSFFVAVIQMKKRINVTLPLMVNGSKAQTLGTFLQDQHQPTELDKPLIRYLLKQDF